MDSDDHRDDRKFGRREERRYDRRDERRFDSRDDHRPYPPPPPDSEFMRNYNYRPDKRTNFDNYGYGATQNYSQYAPPYNAYPPAEYPPQQPVYTSPYNYPVPAPASNVTSTPPNQPDIHAQYTYPPTY